MQLGRRLLRAEDGREEASILLAGDETLFSFAGMLKRWKGLNKDAGAAHLVNRFIARTLIS